MISLCRIIEISQFRGSCLTIYLHVFALDVAILFHFMLSIGSLYIRNILENHVVGNSGELPLSSLRNTP